MITYFDTSGELVDGASTSSSSSSFGFLAVLKMCSLSLRRIRLIVRRPGFLRLSSAATVEFESLRDIRTLASADERMILRERRWCPQVFPPSFQIKVQNDRRQSPLQNLTYPWPGEIPSLSGVSFLPRHQKIPPSV